MLEGEITVRRFSICLGILDLKFLLAGDVCLIKACIEVSFGECV